MQSLKDDNNNDIKKNVFNRLLEVPTKFNNEFTIKLFFFFKFILSLKWNSYRYDFKVNIKKMSLLLNQFHIFFDVFSSIGFIIDY